MKIFQFKSSDSGEIDRFEEGLKMAKYGIMEVCDIWEDMKEQFSERRGGYSERRSDPYRMDYRMDNRGGSGGGGGYSERQYERDGYSYGRGEWDEMNERRGRGSRR